MVGFAKTYLRAAAALAGIIASSLAVPNVRAQPAAAATKPATATPPVPPRAAVPPAKLAAPAPIPDGLPSQADVQAAFDAQDYAGVLQRLQRLLILKGKAAEPYDRHALLVLKAEAHLRLKASGPAAQAFAEAAKVAPDGPSAAADIAAELLVRRGGAVLTYQPKLKDPNDKTKAQPPIDFVDPDGRRRATAALFADEWAVAEPRVKGTGPLRSLDGVMAMLPAVRNLRWLEMAATGKDDRSRGLLGPVAAKAKTAIESFLKEAGEAVDPIEIQSYEVTTARVPRTDQQSGKILGFVTKFRRVGPTQRQFATLKDVFAQTTKLRETCDEVGGSLGSTGHEFDDAKAKADQLRLRAGTLLDTDWTTKFDQPPTSPKPAKP